MKRGEILRRRPLRPPLEPSLKRTAFQRASSAQRGKVASSGCIACGSNGPADPAHLVPRSKGGCDHSDCVVALCRVCHRRFDDGRLDLLPYLEPEYRRELAHALVHVGLAALLRRLGSAPATSR